MGVAKFTHHTVVVFNAIGFVLLLYRAVNRLYLFLLQPNEGKHCRPSSTSFGLVDRSKGNCSATGRANSSSGRGKSITPALETCVVLLTSNSTDA